MSNTHWKKTEVPAGFVPASSLAASWPSPLRREAFAAAMRSQDSVLGGRRLLVSQHIGGCNEWLVDNTATGNFAQSKPLADVWRVTARVRTEMMPGSVLTARVLAVPSGPVEYFGAGSLYLIAGISGQMRFVIHYDNVAADTADVTATFGLAASTQDDGVEDTSTDGRAWQQLQHRVVQSVRPANAAVDPAEAAKWAEWPTITVSVEHCNGARVVHSSLTEEPFEHTVEDIIDAETTCNGIRTNQQLTGVYPVEDELDGLDYEEHRHGVHRLLDVAARQSARVGPRICHWSAWSEELAEINDTEADAISITSATPVRVSWQAAGSNTSWNADAPGFDILRSQRLPENLSSRLSGAAVSPVRLRVYARFSGAGANTGYLRVQSSPRSSVTVAFSQAAYGTTWTWVTITGFLETNVASDDAYCIVQDFAWTTGGTFELRYWDLSYGDYETGA